MPPATVEGRVRALLLSALGHNLRRDPIPESIPAACYATRIKSGLSAREFAAQVGTSHATISRLESGGGKATRAVLVRLAEAADRHRLHNTANYIRLQADFLEMETWNKGGKRK